MTPFRSRSVALFLGCCFAGAVHAQTLPSRPAGYIRLTVPAHGRVLASLPFEPFAAANVLAGQMQPGDVCRTWDATNQIYCVSERTAVGWSQPLDLHPGTGFFLENNQPTDQAAFFCGAVSLDAERALQLDPPLALIGYPYSTPANAAETTLGSSPAVRLTDENAAPVETLQPGRGYWAVVSNRLECVERGAGVPVVAGTVPCITSLLPVNGGVSMTINAGTPACRISIFSKVYMTTGRQDWVEGWVLQASGLTSGEAGSVCWSDNSAVVGDGRLYMAVIEEATAASVEAPVEALSVGPSQTTLPEMETVSDVPQPAGEAPVAAMDADSIAVVEAIPPHEPAAAAEARTIYVDGVAGRDVATGLAREQAKATLRSALDVSQPGDLLVIAAGTYHLSGPWTGNVKVKTEGRVIIR